MDWIQFVYLVTQEENLTAVLMKIRDDITVILCTRISERITEERVRELWIREFILKPSFEEQAG